MLKFVFVVGLTTFFCLAFGDNYVKTNENTAILQRQKCLPGTLVSGNIRFMWIFTGVIGRGGVS